MWDSRGNRGRLLRVRNILEELAWASRQITAEQRLRKILSSQKWTIWWGPQESQEHGKGGRNPHRSRRRRRGHFTVGACSYGLILRQKADTSMVTKPYHLKSVSWRSPHSVSGGGLWVSGRGVAAVGTVAWILKSHLGTVHLP